jgi:hypothetical protein
MGPPEHHKPFKDLCMLVANTFLNYPKEEILAFVLLQGASKLA